MQVHFCVFVHTMVYVMLNPFSQIHHVTNTYLFLRLPFINHSFRKHSLASGLLAQPFLPALGRADSRTTLLWTLSVSWADLGFGW